MATEKILLQLELDVSQITANLQKTIGQITLFKDEQGKLNKELKDLKSSGQENSATYENIQKKLIQVKTNLAFLSQEQRNYEKQLQTNLQANKAEEGSYEQLIRMHQLAQIELKKQEGLLRTNSDGTIVLTDAYKKASEKVDIAKTAIIQFDQGIKDGRTNVGNYKVAIDAAFKDFNVSKEKVAQLKFEILQLKNAFSVGSVDQETYNVKIKDLETQLESARGESTQFQDKLEELKKGTEEGGEGFKRLSVQVREAEEAAQKAEAQFERGIIDQKQLVAAQQKVADLKEELDDFRARVDALNPEAKFKAFTQVAAGLAGGIGAAQGAMALFGAESDDVGRSLLKVQQFMQFSQGLNQLTTLGDSFKNLRIVLGLTTVAQKAQNVAQVEGAGAAQLQAGAQGELAAAQVTSTGTTRTLTAALGLMTSPLALIAIGIAAVVAAFKIYDAVTAEAKENTESLIEASDLEIAAAKRTVEARTESVKREQEAQQQKLQLMQAEGKSDKELFDFKQRGITLIQNMQDDALEANQQNLQALHDYEIRLGKNAQQASSETEREKIREKQAAVSEYIKTLEKTNEEIILDQQRSDNELAVSAVQLKEKQVAIARETAEARVSLIRDAKTREIQQEKVSNDARIAELRKNEQQNAELIQLVTIQSLEKIRQIKQKYAEQEVVEKNSLEIASTIEGTRERFQVEIQSEERLRRVKLENTQLTETQKQILIAESFARVSAIKKQERDLENAEARESLRVLQERRDAELKIQQAKAQPGDNQAELINTLQEITNVTRTEIENRNQLRNEELSEIRAKTQNEIEQLMSSEDFKAQELSVRQDRVSKIIEEGRKKQEDINVLYDTQNVATQAKASQDIVEATRRAEEQKLDMIVQFKQAKLDAASPEEEYQATLDLLAAQQEAEVKHAQDSIANAQNREQAIALINERYARAKEKLDEQVMKNALANTSNMLSQAASLFKKHTAAYKALASAQTIIDTYTSATAAYKAMAGIPYVGPVLGAIAAGVAIAAGLTNLAKINEVQFYTGGYTGDGDPRQESRALGKKPWGVYHKQEYVIDHQTLRDPVVSQFVSSVIEPKRLKKSYPPSAIDGYASGGFTDPSVVISQTNRGLSLEEIESIVETTAASTLKNMPPIVTIVQDVTEAQGIVTKVEQRANF